LRSEEGGRELRHEHWNLCREHFRRDDLRIFAVQFKLDGGLRLAITRAENPAGARFLIYYAHTVIIM
jgi:hypothetical protein